MYRSNSDLFVSCIICAYKFFPSSSSHYSFIDLAILSASSQMIQILEKFYAVKYSLFRQWPHCIPYLLAHSYRDRILIYEHLFCIFYEFRRFTFLWNKLVFDEARGLAFVFEPDKGLMCTHSQEIRHFMLVYLCSKTVSMFDILCRRFAVHCLFTSFVLLFFYECGYRNRVLEKLLTWHEENFTFLERLF